MADAECWVELSCRGSRLGAGLLLTNHFAVTAFHCIRGIEGADERLDVSFSTGEVVPGRVYESSPEADLALVDILRPRESPIVLPSADRADKGDLWSAPYRPSTSDPYLSGEVLSQAIKYRLETGHDVEALQLECSQHLGDYAGYSGGPVQRSVTGKDLVVLGVMLEQYPDRQAGDRASNVLFAATIAEVLRRFGAFNVGHLLKVLTGAEAPPAERPGAADTGTAVPTATGISADPAVSGRGQSLDSRIAAAESLIAVIRDWGMSGVLDPMSVSGITAQVARRLVDTDWAGADE